MGLAPWAHDSGRQQGHRAIRGGRGPVRRVLYLAALAAIRYNAPLRRFYQGLRPRGKPGQGALVAVMRKLLLMLHALARPPQLGSRFRGNDGPGRYSLRPAAPGGFPPRVGARGDILARRTSCGRDARVPGGFPRAWQAPIS